jgi:hypothetical protein
MQGEGGSFPQNDELPPETSSKHPVHYHTAIVENVKHMNKNL